ncbi:MAG: FecR family protein [Sphingobacteriales bacterium]|nr:FecR family protein [Sphingobacteriales bacterium]
MESFNLNEEESVYLLLIIQKIEKVISIEDDLKLQAWRNLSSENNSFYQEIVDTENSLSLLSVYQKLQVNPSLENLHHKLNISKKAKPEKYLNKLKSFSPKHWLGIAASISIITFSILYFYHLKDIVTISTTNLNTKNIALPDGSTIFLNNNTEVTYSKSKFITLRELKLSKGECFLNIVHQPDKPFSIEYKDIKVTDVGTSFNFKVSKNQVIVNVQTGEVKLNIVNKPIDINAKAGEFVSYDWSNQRIVKEKISDLNFKAFVDHHLYFNDSSLEEVVKTLEEVYHRQIIIENEALKSKKLTAEFKDQKFEDILLVIAKTLDINIQTKNDIVYLD